MNSELIKVDLKLFVKEENEHVKLESENNATVHDISSGKSTSCNDATFEIWKWVGEHNI